MDLWQWPAQFGIGLKRPTHLLLAMSWFLSSSDCLSSQACIYTTIAQHSCITHDSRYICQFVIYVHSGFYFNTLLIVIVFVFCTCILELNTPFSSAVLLKVSPDIEKLQLLPSKLYIFDHGLPHLYQTAQGVPKSSINPFHIKMWLCTLTSFIFSSLISATGSHHRKMVFLNICLLQHMTSWNSAWTLRKRPQNSCGIPFGK